MKWSFNFRIDTLNLKVFHEQKKMFARSIQMCDKHYNANNSTRLSRKYAKIWISYFDFMI